MGQLRPSLHIHSGRRTEATQLDRRRSAIVPRVEVRRGVAAKLNRANAHLADMGAAVEAYLAADPFAADRSVREDGRVHVITWTRTAPIPEMISLLAGDAVHNLRSALDHLAVELERLSAQRSSHTLTAKEERRPQFPVARSQSEFDRQIGQFSHLDLSTIDVLKTFQPFVMTPIQPEQSFLWQVSDLDNLDKHRMLAPIPISPVMVTPLGHRGHWVAGLSVPYAVGVEIGRFEFDDPTSAAEMPIEFLYGLTLGTLPWAPTMCATASLGTRQPWRTASSSRSVPRSTCAKGRRVGRPRGHGVTHVHRTGPRCLTSDSRARTTVPGRPSRNRVRTWIAGSTHSPRHARTVGNSDPRPLSEQ